MIFREFALRGVSAVSLRPRADIVERFEREFIMLIETSRAGYGIPGRERSRELFAAFFSLITPSFW